MLERAGVSVGETNLGLHRQHILGARFSLCSSSIVVLMPRTFTTYGLDEVAELFGWGPDEIVAKERSARRAALRGHRKLGQEPDAELLAQIAEDERLYPGEG